MLRNRRVPAIGPACHVSPSKLIKTCRHRTRLLRFCQYANCSRSRSTAVRFGFLLQPYESVSHEWTTFDPHGRVEPTAIRFSISPQPGAGTTHHRQNRNSPWPDLFRPPTSSKKALWTAGKAWMTGTSPVKGTWSCSRIATNNRLPSTGQPWAEPGQGDSRLYRPRYKQPFSLNRSRDAACPPPYR